MSCGTFVYLIQIDMLFNQMRVFRFIEYRVNSNTGALELNIFFACILPFVSSLSLSLAINYKRLMHINYISGWLVS